MQGWVRWTHWRMVRNVPISSRRWAPDGRSMNCYMDGASFANGMAEWEKMRHVRMSISRLIIGSNC